jgi:Glycosyl hydrolase family 76
VLRLTLVLVLAAALAGPAAASVNADRARASQAVLTGAFATSSPGLFTETPGGSLAYLWPFSQALAATVAVAALPDATAAERSVPGQLLVGLERYKRGTVYASKPGGDVYVDDNEWIALDLLDWYGISGDRRAAVRAQKLLGLAFAAWGGRVAGPCAGGVYWTERPPNRDRNTVTTGAGALLAARLGGIPGMHAALPWWRHRMLDWLDLCLRRGDNAYADHMRLDGVIDQSVWSYNQGLVLGAKALASRTGDPYALADAQCIARASLRFLAPWTLGAEPPEFVSVLARNLLLLGAIDGDPRWRAAVQAYADAAWAQGRDPATGLFRVGSPPSLIQQAAFVQIYALLARPSVIDAR